MADKTLAQRRAEQGAFTLSGGDFIPVENAAGNTRVITVDELSQNITGNTVAENNQCSFRGARLEISSQKTINDTTTPLAFDAATFDSSSYWSASNPSRLTMQAGDLKAVFTGSIYAPNGSTITAKILKNGVELLAFGPDSVTVDSHFNVFTGVIEVSSGDYFELTAEGVTIIPASSSVWFDCQIVDVV